MKDTHDTYTSSAKLLHGVTLGAIFVFCLFTPYLVFGIVPFFTSGDEGTSVAASVEVPLPAGFTLEWASTEEEAQALADFKWCRFCHTLEQGEEHRTGPNLYNILGAPVAGKPVFYYSDSLRQLNDKGQVWTYDLLDAYIRDPKTAAPGTRMRYPPDVAANMLDDAARARAIKYMLIHTR